MGYNQRLSEALAIVDCIDPDAYGTGTTTGDTIDMQMHRRVMFIVMAGELGSGATVDFKVYGSASSNMSSAELITGKEITQITDAGSGSDKQAVIEVTAEEVAAQGLRYIRGSLIIGTDTSDAGVVTLADWSRYSPASELDLSSVSEIVG